MNQISISKAISLAQSSIPKDSPFFSVSEGWEDIFSVRSTLTPVLLNNFLNPRENVATGLALQNNNQKREEIAFHRLQKIVERSNQAFHERAIRVNGEGKFGEPLKKFRSQSLSRSNLVNLESFNQLCIACEGYFNKKINVLEIGGGYGELARQTIKYSEFDIGSWHFVDLPQNLLLAEFYLGSIFGKDGVGKTCFFKKEDFDTVEGHSAHLNFYLPSEVDNLTDKFDLVINTYSLQEMRLDVVQSYLQKINSVLSSDGLIFSINSPKKWDIKRYSDYGFQEFTNVYSVMHRQVPPGGERATVPIVNVFAKRMDGSPKVDERLMNVIGELQVLGFCKFLTRRFCNGRLSITDPSPSLISFLNQVLGVIDGSRTQDDYQCAALVLGKIINGEDIPESCVNTFVESLDIVTELSDLSVLVMRRYSSHKVLRKLENNIRNEYLWPRTGLIFKAYNFVKSIIAHRVKAP